jgi:Sec-independent protein translocase protein TatA
MFDLALSQVLLTVGVASLVVSRQDLPRFARIAGRSLGRAVHLLRSQRDAVLALSQKHDLAKLHQDLRSALNEVEKIKSEVRGTLSIERGPVFFHPTSSEEQPRSQAHSQPPIVPELQAQPQLQPQSQVPLKTVADCPKDQSSMEPPASSVPYASVAPTAVASSLGGFSMADMMTQMAKQQKQASKMDSMPSGADIVSEALLERHFAKFLQRQQQQQQQQQQKLASQKQQPSSLP